MQLFANQLECEFLKISHFLHLRRFSDPHFDGRPSQISGRVQTVGRFEKVTKSRSLDRSKNRSADRWSQEDFEKTNRMAMRELQRPRNKSLPINTNESNNRTDQQMARHSPVPVTPREVITPVA